MKNDGGAPGAGGGGGARVATGTAGAPPGFRTST